MIRKIRETHEELLLELLELLDELDDDELLLWLLLLDELDDDDEEELEDEELRINHVSTSTDAWACVHIVVLLSVFPDVVERRVIVVLDHYG